MDNNLYTVETSKAFIHSFEIKPYLTGLLDGYTFAVKDLMDVNGYVTGCGNPTWAKTHPKAVSNAVCVDQVLSEGATCLGKTITDELAFSLIGENYFYGTPINPKAPEHIPGGSSSGSASAVACGLVDFAFGTDTGGSVRTPASNCGILGFRPSHDRISLSGVNPLASSFDTVSLFANKIDVLTKVVQILLGSTESMFSSEKNNIQLVFLDDIFKLCDIEVVTSLSDYQSKLINSFITKNTTLTSIMDSPIDHHWLFDTYTNIQCAEIWSALGAWVESENPQFGDLIENNFKGSAKNVNRQEIQRHLKSRNFFSAKLNNYLGQDKILCFPTTPILAPKLNEISHHETNRSKNDYFLRTLGINAIAGLSGAPQITIPCGYSNEGVPIGLSFLCAKGGDERLLHYVQNILNVINFS